MIKSANAISNVDDQADTSTGAFERAGFRVEKLGRATVAERDLPDAVVETTRALIIGNTNGNGTKPAQAQSRNGGAPSVSKGNSTRTGGAG